MKILTQALSIKGGVISYLLTEGIVKAVLLFTIPIFARVLSKGDFGTWSLYISALPLVSVLLDFSQRVSVKRYYLENSHQMKTFILGIYLSIICVTLGCFFVIYIFELYYVDSEFTLTLLSAGMFYALIEVYISYLQMNKNVIFYNLIYGFKSVLPYLIVIPVFCYVGSNYIYFAYIQLAILAIISIYVFFQLEPRLLFGARQLLVNIKYSLKLGSTVLPAIISAFFLTTSDRYMIDYFYGKEEVANYSIAYTVASIFTMLVLASNKAWQPFILSKLQSNEYSRISKFARLYVGVAFFVVLGLYLFRTWLVIFIGGDQYIEVIGMIPIILGGLFFYFLYTVFSNVAFYNNDMLWFSFPAGICAIINIVLNYILLPLYGYEIAALTTLISYFFEFLIIFGICIFKYKIPLFWQLKIS